MIQSSIGTGGTVEIDLCDVGIVVLDHEGRVTSTNARARELLRAEAQLALNERVRDLQRELTSKAAAQSGSMDETAVDLPGLDPLGVRGCDVAGVAGGGRVLLLRDGRSLPGTASLLQQAARHRTFSFLSRDWAHDLKGMLHVIRINSAILGRLLQRESATTDAAVTRCLDAIPREVERLDRAIELMFHAKPAEEPTTFDIGTMCERLKTLIAARAVRQRVEVALELKSGPMEIVGFEDQVLAALLNVLVNALEAMPEQGRLVISADGDATRVSVRISDSGAGMQPQLTERQWKPRFVNDQRQTGIGLHVTRAIVESQGGRIECASNVPRGTCIEITFPRRLRQEDSHMAHALIVDDSASTLESLEQLVKLEGFTTATAATMDQARVELAKQPPDVVLVDLNLPDGSGLSLCDSINGLSDTPPAVVLITGQASLDSAVEALRRGVSDYLTKPLDVERLRKILQDISQTKRLPDELRELRSEQARTGRFVGIVGRSDPILRACELITRIAPSSASVLITGESGSGKDVVARAIHELSRRRHGPWVPVNCGAITPSLMESELFGHERGSFTGAERRHKGYFEQASRGTLFLDEITEMPIELQVKLLRVLETNSLARVGAEQSIQVDVRIVAASNRNVQQAIDEGKLRADLYYRLKVFQIDLAPLRDRRDDVKLLAQAFLEDLIQSEGRAKRFSERAFEMLAQYNWPGNVRELKNVVHFAYVLSEDTIDIDSLPAEVQRGGRAPEPQSEAKSDSGAGAFTVRVGSTIAEVERRLILATLREYQEDKPKSANVLGISLKTLYNRLNQYQAPDGQSGPDEQGQARTNEVEVVP